MAEVTTEYTSLNDRIASVDKDVNSLRSHMNNSIEKLRSEIELLKLDSTKHQIKYETILEKLDAITDTVNNLQSKPAKRWDSIVDKIIWLVVEATLVFMLVKLGLK